MGLCPEWLVSWARDFERLRLGAAAAISHPPTAQRPTPPSPEAGTDNIKSVSRQVNNTRAASPKRYRAPSKKRVDRGSTHCQSGLRHCDSCRM